MQLKMRNFSKNFHDKKNKLKLYGTNMQIYLTCLVISSWQFTCFFLVILTTSVWNCLNKKKKGTIQKERHGIGRFELMQ